MDDHEPRNKRRRYLSPAFLVLLSMMGCKSFIPQHRVRRSHRRVPYKHVVAGLPRPKEPRFWTPGSHSSTKKNDGKSHHRRNNSVPRMFWNEVGDGGDVLWHLHLDASQKHAKSVLQQAESSLSQKNGFRGTNRRGLQVAEKFTQGGRNSEGSNNQSLSSTEETDVLGTNSSRLWNVSTEIEYFDDSSFIFTTTSREGKNSLLYRPIRIRAILSEQGSGGQFLSQAELEVLFRDILSPALLAWGTALRVDPVVGNLTVDARQLVDGISCGPGLKSGFPSILVPPDHFTEGIGNTDFVLYLGLSFVQTNETEADTEASTDEIDMGGNKTTGSTSPGKGGPTHIFNSSQIPATDEGSGASLKQSSPASASSGNIIGISSYNVSAPNASFLTQNITIEFPLKGGNHSANETIQNLTESNEDMATSIEEPPRPYCSGAYLAASTYCSTDQFDRPTAAMMHICIGSDFFDPSSLPRNIITVKHELGHALGFNPQSMAHFRKQDGSPITERVDGDVPDITVECTGPVETRTKATIPLPSEKILRFETVRDGVRVAQIVTPSVQQVVRNHFDCQSLHGAELESGNVYEDGDDNIHSSCIGSHWERRLFRTDLMNPIIADVPFSMGISPITLALFADSGWYQVDLSRASVAASWGRAAGCDFVEKTCIGEGGRVSGANEPFFCNDVVQPQRRGTIDEIHGCSPDLSQKALCSIVRYDSELPEAYEYFGSTLGANVGGNEPFIDFCPVYNGFENGNCKDEDNELTVGISSSEEFGERNSRCLSGLIAHRRTAFCLPIACVIEDKSLRVRVDRTWHVCEAAGDKIRMPSETWTAEVFCPDPIRTCPTFYCNRDCLGTQGVCAYETGNCMCTLSIANSFVLAKCGDEAGDMSNGHFFFAESSSQEMEESPVLDSQLLEYYVPDSEALEGAKKPKNLVLIWVSVSTGCVFGVLLLCYLIQRRLSCCRQGTLVVQETSTPTDPEEVQPSDAAFSRRNKDKFVASLLVDLRVHDPRLRQQEAAAQTAGETDSSCHYESSVGFDSEFDDFESIYGESNEDSHQESQIPPPPVAQEEEEEPPASVMRRRAKPSFC